MPSTFTLSLLAMSVAMLAASSPGEVPAETRLAADAEARWIRFDLTPGNQIRFGMVLDGRPITAVLDTGASHSLLSRSSPLVRPDRLRPGGTATAIGGDVAVQWMPVDALALGGLTRRGGGVTVALLPADSTGSAAPIDLLVGRDLLADHALDIDYPLRRFRLLPSGRLPFRGAVAPLRISPQRLVFESEVTLAGQRIAPVVVDTGDGAALTVTADAWRRAAPAGIATTTTIAFGIAGAMVSELAIVPAVAIGSLPARAIETRVEPSGGFSTATGTAGRIGSGLLQRYRVLLDPGAGRMVLDPRGGTDTSPMRSTSGLLVGLAVDRLRILHVMRGGPGEAGGWRTGDTICTVDGRAIGHGYPTSALARWSIAAPGTATRLGDCAGGERTLVARFFY